MRLVIPPDAKSWVPVIPGSHFPIQNLPIGLARLKSGLEVVAIRIGDYALDMHGLLTYGLIPADGLPGLDRMIDLDKESSRRLRELAYGLLIEENETLRDKNDVCHEVLVPIDDVQMLVPVDIPAFVDFYSGINHASNVGRMFRPDMPPLLPNYRHLPVAYNGRASSVIVSGNPVHRPSGQTKAADAAMPSFGPTQELDFELELGFFISDGNDHQKPIPIGEAEDHMLGLVLVNDWSARDIQRWEYQPLGPFLAKSFATSISPWIVSLDALEPFRIQGETQEPPVLPYLLPPGPCHFDIRLKVEIQTAKMHRPQVISRSNAKYLYWSFAQQLAHQTSNGTNTEPGDLYGSGTISGSEPGTFGSLLELTWRGQHKLVMEETGEERTFLEDGDTVIFNAYAQGEDYRVGFGELRATVVGS